MALGQRRYIGYTMYRVVPFNPTGYTSQRGGRQVAAPTVSSIVIPFFGTAQAPKRGDTVAADTPASSVAVPSD